MKALHLFLCLSLCVASLPSIARGQQPGQQPTPSPGLNAPRYGYAVVDITYLFKMYSKFNQQMAGMKTAMEQADNQLKVDREAVTEKEKTREQFQPSSSEFKQIDEEIARLKAEFQLKAAKIRRDFMEREAQVYYNTFLEVSNAVQYYAQQHNIGLVLRFNGDGIDPNDRESILRAINRPVVFQNSVDITPDVLNLLERGSNAPSQPVQTANGAAAAGAAAGAPRHQ